MQMDNLKLNNIELRILQFLFEHENQYYSSQRIGKECQVSDKTVRKYIKTINSIIKEYGAVIEMKKGSGYQLIIIDSNKFYHFLDLIRGQRNTIEDSRLLTDNNDRERFILNALLLENQSFTINELTELMYVSESTVSAVIQMIKKRLEEFDLEIIYNEVGWIIINGDELNKRRFILNYFFPSSSRDNYGNIDFIDFQDKGFSAETIFIIVLEKCREFDIRLSDFVLQSLVLHIVLAIKRNGKGYTINKMTIDENIEYSKELFVAKKIISSIEKLIDIKFSQDEAKYIALHLKSKANNQYLTKDKPAETELSLQTQIIEVLNQLQNQNEIHFSMDQQLIMGLTAHFEPLLARLKMDINLKNPLLNEIKEKYGEKLKLTKKYFSRMPILSSYTVDDHEWAYISLHILAAIERYEHDHKVNVIVICATGLGSAQMLRSRIENKFAKNINVVEVISYYQLNNEMLKDIDLIITTIDLSTSFYNIPIVKVSVLLNQKDIDSLNKYINYFALTKEETISKEVAQNKISDWFHLYFNEKRFIIFDSPINREEAINKMIQTLTDADHPSFKEDLKKQIHLREQFGTLAFTKDVAFPHPAQPIGINSELVVGIVPSGIEWDYDFQDVKMIVLMSPSKIENKGLDIINSGLTEFISCKDNINLVIESLSFENFKKLFIETQIE